MFLRTTAAAGAFLASTLAFFAAAQEYPARPVKLVVAFAAGGGADLVARQVAAQLSTHLPQPVVVENMPGKGGVTATEAVARAAPDGYTLLVANPAVMAINPTLYPDMKVDTVRDLAPVARIAGTPLLGIVPASLPAKDIGDFVALTKSKPTEYKYGSGGAGNINQVGVELFKARTGARLAHVPGKSSSAAIEDLAAGNVQFMMDGAHTVGKHIRAGKLRVLVAFHDKRVAAMPDVPTAREAGLPADLLVSSWFGIGAPAGTPPAAIAALQKALRAALEAPKFRDEMVAQGTEPAYLDQAAFAAFIAAERRRWSETLRSTPETQK